MYLSLLFYFYTIMENIFSKLYYSMHTLNPIITERQKQIIMGTILGGSSIVVPKKGKNCYLSMRDKRKNWLELKAGELQLLSSNFPFTSEKTNRWHSKCYPVFNEFKNMFYKNNKRFLEIDVLSKLSDISFAIWLGDCGTMHDDKLVLNTHIWGDSNKTIIAYFELLGYKSNIIKEGISLDSNSSKDFINYAAPHLPEWLSLHVLGKKIS